MSNFPIQIDKLELKEWHEFAKLEGFDSTAAFVRQTVRDRIQGRKDTLELLKMLGISADNPIIIRR